MNLLSKVSFKAVCGVPEMQAATFQDETGATKTALRGIEKQYMRVVGIVRGTKTTTSQYGDSIEFQGEFEAINMLTAEVYNGSKLFLPQIAEGFLFSAVSCAEGNAVEFAFDIGIKPSATPMGYEYTIKPLIEQTQESPLKKLMAGLPPLLKIGTVTDTETGVETAGEIQPENFMDTADTAVESDAVDKVIDKKNKK
jgi:hypothetical protein